MPEADHRPRSFANSPNHAPEWAADAICYHIYPLGFLGAPARNNGRSRPKPRLRELRRWYEHLRDLGVNTILFGPLFESERHGYDTVDYRRIDRRLGDMELFAEIVAELHDQGFRVVLDGVFNHTGRSFFAFRHLREHGPTSPYAAWYQIDPTQDSPYGDGFSYHCWHGHFRLPTLNVMHPDVRDYLFETARFYLADIGIDGWRLDAAEDVSPAFWRDLRAVCKRARPDCFLLGELVQGAYDRYLAPGCLDAATHYPLYGDLIAAMNEQRLPRLGRLLRRDQNRNEGRTLVSFLGNHDVTRVRSHLHHEAHFYPAMVLLMGLPYLPCLYYGDECGMTGRKEHGDAALRQPMPAPEGPWPDANGDRHRETARLAALRHQHAVLRHGRIVDVTVRRRQMCVVLQRFNTTAVIAVNLSERTQTWRVRPRRKALTEGTALVDVLHPDLPIVRVQDGALDLDPLYPCWGRILIQTYDQEPARQV